MTPRGFVPGLFACDTSLNQPNFLSLSTNHRRRQLDRCSPFFVSQPQYSGRSCHAMVAAAAAAAALGTDEDAFIADDPPADARA